jgi:Amt family ammonium transporter
MVIETAQIQFEKEHRYLSLIAEIRKSFYDQNEQELVQTFLDSATRLFHLAKAWYGICTDNIIRPVFHAGTVKNCIDFTQIDRETETEPAEPPEKVNNKFPLLQAIAQKQPIVLHYLDQQEQFAQWKTFLENSKCRSILAVPVEIHQKIEAGIVFYSFSPDSFDPQTTDDLVRSIRELTGIIAEKRNWTKQLKELKKSKELAEADALKKTRFLANMSHEIRTPMTAILGFTEILINDYLSPTQQENNQNNNENNKDNRNNKNNENNGTNRTINISASESSLDTLKHCKNIAQIIHSNAQFLLSILNDILDFSKLEVDMMKVEKIAVPLQPFLRELAMFYAVQARAKNLTFIIKALTPLPKLMNTDPVRFKQILVNLLGNALKFTQQGEIDVSIAWVDADTQNSPNKCQKEKSTKKEGNLFFSVRDTGIGISQDILATLFVPFQQADAGTTRQFGNGSGLGLVISKQLIRLLGGEMIVKSRAGFGSTFTVVLPQQFDQDTPFETIPVFESLSADYENKNSDSETSDWLNSNSDSNTNSNSDTNSDANSTTLTSSSPLNGRRILLAEDAQDSRRLFSLIMKKAGAEVIEAENGQVAVEIVAKNMDNVAKNRDNALPFDIILMDMEMPVMDGYAATRQLRKMGYTNPIMALTAHTLSEEHRKCLDAGCNDFTTKPILRNALITAIVKHLK